MQSNASRPKSPASPSARVLAGIGLEARRLDTGDRASLVAVGGVRGILLAKALDTLARWEALTPQELENLAGARQEKPSADCVHRDLAARPELVGARRDRKSTRLNSSHSQISYAGFCFEK